MNQHYRVSTMGNILQVRPKIQNKRKIAYVNRLEQVSQAWNKSCFKFRTIVAAERNFCLFIQERYYTRRILYLLQHRWKKEQQTKCNNAFSVERIDLSRFDTGFLTSVKGYLLGRNGEKLCQESSSNHCLKISTVDVQKSGNQKSRSFNFPAQISGVHFHIFCIGVMHTTVSWAALIFRWCCMPKCHVDSFFHMLTKNTADFDLLIIDFAGQVVIIFKYVWGTSYKIITFKNLAVLNFQGCQFFEGQL